MSSSCPHCERELPDPTAVEPVCPFCRRDLLKSRPEIFCVMDGVDIRQMAKQQRRLLVFIALTILVSMLLWGYVGRGPMFVGLPLIGIGAAVYIVDLVLVVQIITAFQVHVTVVYFMTTLILIQIFSPCIDLRLSLGIQILLLFIAYLNVILFWRKIGMRVGLLGISDAEVLRILNPQFCQVCGYDLTGNVSGRCPECGTALSIETMQYLKEREIYTAASRNSVPIERISNDSD